MVAEVHTEICIRINNYIQNYIHKFWFLPELRSHESLVYINTEKNSLKVSHTYKSLPDLQSFPPKDTILERIQRIKVKVMEITL